MGHTRALGRVGIIITSGSGTHCRSVITVTIRLNKRISRTGGLDVSGIGIIKFNK